MTVSGGIEDAIYLAREDGLVRYLEIGKVRDKFELFVDMSDKLDVNIDRAFAAVAASDRSADILIIGGSGCDGGVFLVSLLSRSKSRLASNMGAGRTGYRRAALEKASSSTKLVAIQRRRSSTSDTA